MSFFALVNLGFAAFALCVAIFHLWIYRMRPRDAAHFWIAVVSLGVVWVAGSYAALYEARSLGEAQRAQLAGMVAALPLVIGFVRFSELYVGVENRLLRLCVPYSVVMLAAAYAKPSLLFNGELIRVSLPLGGEYVRAGLAPSAGIVFLGFAVMILSVVGIYARRARTIEGGGLITLALAGWGAGMAHDLCVAVGLYEAPWLLPLGFSLFSGAFGSILLRRLVRAHTKLERSAGELHTLVETRTAELRRKDLELAHGARLGTLGALAGGIAHEIGEPLAAVSSHVKELRDAWRDERRPAAFGELLTQSQHRIERIRTVVAELLQLARREESQPGRHELHAIVAGVLPIAGYELSRRARLETDLASAPAVAGDGAMLAQVVLNLLVGAIHAIEHSAPQGPLITLSTGGHAGGARLVVSDNAPALPTELAADLFELAAAGGGEDQRRIGFVVTKQLVERHGGTFTIESGEAGTRVTVDLPAACELGESA